jgi:integrase/recombinase XerC
LHRGFDGLFLEPPPLCTIPSRYKVCGLDVEHVDLTQGAVSILGKGRHQREWLSLPDETRDALKAWLAMRGSAPGPLMIALDPRAYGRRLRGDGAALVIGKMGEGIGARVRPHGLRHAAITDALNATDGNLRLVQKYSRHRCLDMLLVYDDARGDFGGQVAKMVAKRTARPRAHTSTKSASQDSDRLV